MKNNTQAFIKAIDRMMIENKEYFTILRGLKNENNQALKAKVYNDFNLENKESHFNSLDLFKSLISNHILSCEISYDMDASILRNISAQLEIEYLQNKMKKEDAIFYCSFSDALTHYGIYKGSKLPSFQFVDFWNVLLKMFYVLSLMNNNNYSSRCDDNFLKMQGYDKLSRLVDAVKNINDKLNEELDIIDGCVSFKQGQEERIVRKIEGKMSRLNLFNALRFIFNIYNDNKNKHKIEITLPYKYILNILIKNISNSNHKSNNKKKICYAIELLTSFISLYQLKEDKFAVAGLSSLNVVEHLTKQVLYSNFYPIYSLKTTTLIDYINNIIQPSIDNDSFVSCFGFSLKDLVDFFRFLDKQKDDVISISNENVFKSDLKILELFSVDANIINKNYSTKSSLLKSENLFAMNPVVKYKNMYYIIGFKYFKLNFYNSLLDKIRKSIDGRINSKIGSNIDLFVEKTFFKIQKNHGYQLYSGNYTPPKKENPESDLLIETERDLILIENKNKYLTHASFSGSEPNILKDFVLSYVFSQKQLLKHERNLRTYKQIIFTKDQRVVNYDGQNIVKISVSTNNWFNIMINPSAIILPIIRNLRFSVKDDESDSDFVKANKYLDELNSIIDEFEKNNSLDMPVILNQTVFLPLELLIDKSSDDEFIEILKQLVAVKMNTDNVMNVYDYCKYLIGVKTSAIN
ncbi:hypothetical protein [Escherichia coli]|uniref:hypothetical protein n=1 Tax=Escherichia coli TaxID=562 RepID=UPI00085431C2|nr:hypothetical protein [Escherichia coli]OEM10851.1 hypothetical protein BHF18_13095 [Escherichia coli]